MKRDCHKNNINHKSFVRHPLNMSFGKYLNRLSDEEIERRMGRIRYEAYKRGDFDAEEYHRPDRNDKYTADELAEDDVRSFDDFYQNFTEDDM